MNGAGVDLVQAKLSASDLINAYDYKATNQRYYPDLGRLTSSVWNFLARCSHVCFREGPPRRARRDSCLLRLDKSMMTEGILLTFFLFLSQFISHQVIYTTTVYFCIYSLNLIDRNTAIF